MPCADTVQVEDHTEWILRTFDEIAAKGDRNLSEEEFHDVLDRCEAEILRRFKEIDLPLTHTFTPGLYIRQIFMPAGALLTSQIHNTEHPFTISIGLCTVFTRTEGVQLYGAPYTGITKPGTKRLLYIHEDTVWTTYHPNPDNLKDPEEIGDKILIKRENPLLLKEDYV
jgi:hypothetical protein